VLHPKPKWRKLSILSDFRPKYFTGRNLEHAFQIAKQIIDMYALSAVQVLSDAGARLAMDCHVLADGPAEDRITEFLAIIAPIVADAGWDAVLRAMVNELAKSDALKQAEKLVKRMKGPKARIDANIACSKLKAAYLVAVRAKMVDEIVRIKRLAEESNNRGVVKICETYLANFGNR
jgi:zinc finger FYVE domain-containing protein 26